MPTPPAGISEADWTSTTIDVWAGFLELVSQLLTQQQENDQLRQQLTALATELAGLREGIGRTSRNSSKPPCSDGLGFKPPARRKPSGRKRGVRRAIPDRGRSCSDRAL